MNAPLPDAPVPHPPPAGTGGAQADRADRFDAWLQGLPGGGMGLDFYQALRRIEAAHPHLPRLGQARRPADEPVRVSQPPDLSFAPTPVVGLARKPGGGPVLLRQRLFGLLGPNGPLPTHLTELARDRSQHHGDPTLQAFTDLLAQRFSLLFYRAWAEAQPVLSRDRPGANRFDQRLGALFGMAEPALLARDAVGDAAKLHFTGRLSRQVRDADGLQAWCRSELGLPLKVLQWQGHWMPLDRAERTRLAGAGRGQPLGAGAVLGGQVWDVQHKFRIVIGPLGADGFARMLPDGEGLARLRAMVRQWVGLEFEWDVQLVLKKAEVPALRLARQPSPGAPRLGRSTWLGHYRRPQDASDMVMNPERLPRLRRKTPTAAGAHGAAPLPAPALVDPGPRP